MLKLYVGKNVPLFLLPRLIPIDRKIFSGTCQVFSIPMLFWIFKNRKLYDVVVDTQTGKPVAYSLLMPVNERGYRKMMHDLILDIYLRPSDIIRGDKPCTAYLYYGSVAIDPQWQKNSEILFLLDNGLKEKLAEYCAKGVKFKSCFSDCVSSNGERLSRHFGMSFVKKTPRGSSLYEGPFKDNLI